MNKEHIVVIGGGFSGLKVVKLLMSSSKRYAKVTLITSSSIFVFFPLVPDYIAGKITKLDGLTTHVQEFCKKLGAACIIEDCTEIDYEQKRVVGKTGTEIRYDICIICTGNGDSDNHKRIWQLLTHLDRKVCIYRSEKMGLAEFEIMSALQEAGKNIIIENYSKHKDLEKHWIHKALVLNGLEEKYQQINGYIRSNTSVTKWNSSTAVSHVTQNGERDALVIGAALSDLDGCRSSAQRSSYDAHIIGFYMGKGSAMSKCLKEEVNAKLKKYRSRGEMIFVHSEYALIWIGDKPNAKASLSGVHASIIRRVFYMLEFWLYYQTNGAPRMLCKLINRTRILRMASTN